MEKVDLIASGYEWRCPKCKALNEEHEAKMNLCCSSCGKHVYGNVHYNFYECKKCGQKQMFAWICLRCNKLHTHFRLLPRHPEAKGEITYIMKEEELEIKCQTFKE